MGWQPDGDSETGHEPGSGLPGRDDFPPRSEPSGPQPADGGTADSEPANRGPADGERSRRDPHLAGFARDGEWDTCPPSAALAAALQAAAGAGWCCPGASPDELLGVLRQWQAVEAWAAAGRLGVLRALIREDDEPLPGGGYRGDLPEGWSRSLTHEVALALSVPAGSAERQMQLAWDLQARLPGIGALLATGKLTFPVAKAVAEPMQLLSDQDAAAAEAMILAELPGKTYGQAQQLAVRAAVTVDPDAAARRRQDAERNRARVQLFREESGAAALSGRDLPTDQTLAAHASVCARATQYEESGVFPRDTRMDQYRATAYLDLLNNITADTRIATGQLVTRADADPGADTQGVSKPDASNPERDQPDDGTPDHDEPAGNGPGDRSPGHGDPGDDGPGDSDPGDSDPGDKPPGSPGPEPAPLLRPVDVVLPLATLLGLAERPGEGHGLGPLDPDLCRDLAAAAVA